MARRKKPFTMGLGATIISVFVILIVGTAGLIGYISFRNGQKSVADLADQILDSTQIRIEQNLGNFLATPHALNRINASALRDGLVDLRDFSGLRKRFLHQILAFDSVMTCAFGSEGGEFIGAGRRGQNVFDSALADKTMDNDYRVHLLDEQGQPGELVSVVRDYHPQSRPWYQAAIKANGPAWSPIYIWASEANIGISAVLPVYRKRGDLLGVQQAALSLDRIGHFLRNIKVGHTGLIFIMERSGLLVASSVSESLVRNDPARPNAAAERVPATESATPLIRATAVYLKEQYIQVREISGKEHRIAALDGQSYFLSAVPTTDDRGLDWLVVTVIPESDLMGPVLSNIRTTLLAGLIAVIGAILLGVMMTRWITRPITRLSGAVEEMSQGKWEKIEGDIRVKEVSLLADSFNRMADQLRESFATIEHRVEERTRELAVANEHLQAQIVERKRTEEALRESEAFLNATGRIAKVGGWELNAETREVQWTEQTYRIHEVSPGYKPPFEEAIEFFHPEDRQKLAVAIERAIEYGEPYDMELRFISAGGKQLWTRTTCEPQRVEGRTVSLKGTLRDISERKCLEDERLSLMHRLQQAQKAESLGRMAGAIAHHFNNILGVVMGNLELAMIDLPRGSDLRVKLVEALAASGKAADISRLMLSYLGQGIGVRKPIALAEVCREALPLLRSSLPKEVRLKTELPQEGPILSADAGQIREILTNLVVNAGEALKNGDGEVAVAVDVTPAAAIRSLRCYPLDWAPAAENYACLSVSDSGCGIDPETLEKIFDPFFSTKFTGRGLGLAVVLGVVRAHQGAVSVESAPGKGAVFRVFLPLAEHGADQPAPAEPLASVPVEDRGVVLLVEDDAMLRKMAETMLGLLGYGVIAAVDGVDAVEVFREHRDEVQCVLLDLTMPRLDGWQTLAALRKLAPGIPVILTSGYNESQALSGDYLDRPQFFLHKPYRMAELQSALEAVLEGKPGKKNRSET